MICGMREVCGVIFRCVGDMSGDVGVWDDM